MKPCEDCFEANTCKKSKLCLQHELRHANKDLDNEVRVVKKKIGSILKGKWATSKFRKIVKQSMEDRID